MEKRRGYVLPAHATSCLCQEETTHAEVCRRAFQIVRLDCIPVTLINKNVNMITTLGAPLTILPEAVIDAINAITIVNVTIQ